MNAVHPAWRVAIVSRTRNGTETLRTLPYPLTSSRVLTCLRSRSVIQMMPCMRFHTQSRMATAGTAITAATLALLVGLTSPGSAAQKKRTRRRPTTVAAPAAVPAPTPAPAPVQPPVDPSASIGQQRAAAEAAMAQQLLERVNAERAVRGIAPLRWDPGLASMARNWSETMAATQNFSHRPKGSESAFAVPSKCCWENIYAIGGVMGSAHLHDGWMRSTGHRNNILSPEVTAMGAGVVCAAGGTSYATQNFATDTWKGLGTPETGAEPRSPVTGADIRCP